MTQTHEQLGPEITKLLNKLAARLEEWIEIIPADQPLSLMTVESERDYLMRVIDANLCSKVTDAYIQKFKEINAAKVGA